MTGGQGDGEPSDVDPRSDIMSLIGVLERPSCRAHSIKIHRSGKGRRKLKHLGLDDHGGQPAA